MATRERAADRGKQRGQDAVATLYREIRRTRRSLGLSLARVASEVGVSAPTLSRVERGLTKRVSVVVIAQLCEVVGLELSARIYPGGRPLRDARHATLLERFRASLHPSLRWSTEVPLPLPGDNRGWDGAIKGRDFLYGVEAELNPQDGQALVRRITLKARDGQVDGVILLLPDTRQARHFRRLFADLLAADFPVPGARALRLLATGGDPGGSAVVVMPYGRS